MNKLGLQRKREGYAVVEGGTGSIDCFVERCLQPVGKKQTTKEGESENSGWVLEFRCLGQEEGGMLP